MPSRKAHIHVRVDDEIYDRLLAEAGGVAREIPEVVRQKIADSYLTATDAEEMKAQLRFITELVKHLLIDDAPVITRIMGMVEGYPADKQNEERVRLEKVKEERFELIERLRMQTQWPRKG